MDDLLAELRRTNDVVVTLVDELRDRGGVHVNQRSDGGSGSIAVVASFSMLVIFIVFIIMETRSYNELSRKVDTKAAELRADFGPQIDQLRAWKDVQAKEIGKLQAQIPPKEK